MTPAFTAQLCSTNKIILTEAAMFSYDKLISLCESTGCEYSLTAELKDYTSFKIGGYNDIPEFNIRALGACRIHQSA